jgi:hypothetical protein
LPDGRLLTWYSNEYGAGSDFMIGLDQLTDDDGNALLRQHDLQASSAPHSEP